MCRATGVYSETTRDQSEGRALQRSSNPVDSSGGDLRRQTEAPGRRTPAAPR
jgi:hypothetical protein